MHPPAYTMVDVLKALVPVLLILLAIVLLVRRSEPPPLPSPLAPGEEDEEEAEEEDEESAGAASGGANRPRWRRQDSVQWDRVIPAVIAVGFYLLGLWRLGQPNEMVFDEVHHSRTAMEFVLGQNPHEWTHPHFAKLMMAAGLMAWGGHFDPSDGVWQDSGEYPERAVIGWRFPSLVFGALALVVMYALARRLLRHRGAATLATVFLALDGVFFVQSRTAMTNIYTVFFILLATFGVWRFFEEDRARFLALAGLAIGGALSSRWSSLYAWALLLLALFVHHVWSERRQRGDGSGLPLARSIRWAALVLSLFFVLPAAVYLATYIPFVLQGEQGTYAEKLFSADYGNHGWGKVLSMQGDMWRYHSGMKDTHPYNSPWWSWPLVLRPVWYYWRGDGNVTRGIWCIGNVFIWWASIPAFVIAARLAWRQRNAAVALVVLMGLGQWLLWGVKARSLNFLHYMFESIPFVCLALAYIFYSAWRRREVGTNLAPRENMGNGEEEGDAPDPWTAERRFVVFYCALIVAWFLFFYPLLSALPIPQRFYDFHLWMGRPWV